MPPVLLNLIPLPGEVSFQHGYLGYTSASIRGTLQLKYIDSASEYRTQLDRVQVEFKGVERVHEINVDNDDTDHERASEDAVDEATRSGDDASSQNVGERQVELVYCEKVLWRHDEAALGGGTTSRGASGTTSSGSSSGQPPPGALDFQFRLTDDLPHCCHVGSGSLVYTLTARLVARSGKALSISTPVHLTRSSAPPPATSVSSSISSNPSNSDPPEIYTTRYPTEAAVFFPHGTSQIRRSDAIELRVRIPPPDAVLVQEKGLKLRSVSAEFFRHINIRTQPRRPLSSARDADESEITPMVQEETPSLTTLISHSGKAAAFSSTRPVFLNIWLQPVPAESCESVTQSTIFHDVSFSVKVTISFKGRQGDRQEVTIVERPVTIIPDYPAVPLGSIQQDDIVAPPFTSDEPRSQGYQARGSHGGSPKPHPELLRAFTTETEYDGYEQMSEDASVENAPPSIDADEPPPTLEGSGERLHSTKFDTGLIVPDPIPFPRCDDAFSLCRCRGCHPSTPSHHVTRPRRFFSLSHLCTPSTQPRASRRSTSVYLIRHHTRGRGRYVVRDSSKTTTAPRPSR